MLEVEVKIKLKDKTEICRKLMEIGFVEGTTIYEYDTYYNGIYEDFKKTDKAIRIRKHQNVKTNATKYVLNFKGPKIDETTMTREETQFEIPDFEKGNIVIEGLGFRQAGFVEKTRIHYEKGEVTCCIDAVTGLGDYLEIEIMAENDEGYLAAKKQIAGLLEKLNLGQENTIRKSYLSLLEDAK